MHFICVKLFIKSTFWIVSYDEMDEETSNVERE